MQGSVARCRGRALWGELHVVSSFCTAHLLPLATISLVLASTNFPARSSPSQLRALISLLVTILPSFTSLSSPHAPPRVDHIHLESLRHPSLLPSQVKRSSHSLSKMHLQTLAAFTLTLATSTAAAIAAPALQARVTCTPSSYPTL